ncbi:uncharacterized protein LOC132187446 [Corylus avellana]|uniref:uncharacterized protein LOC132187446 n=1 Tax=Corylus avellana TaxID=13451 RepID=UPI00286AC7E6|nr:uncharacterized protein LOC132187446 [Corylus avellana]
MEESSNGNQSENRESKENPREVEELNDSETCGDGNHSISNQNLQREDDFFKIEIQGEEKEIPKPQEEEEEDEEFRDDISETSSSMTDKSSHDSLGSNKMSDDAASLQPHLQLPRPEAPPGLSSSNGDVSLQRSPSLSVDMPAIRKFIRERSGSFSAAIVKRLSSLKENNYADASKTTAKSAGVTEFDLSGMKVIVKLKNNVELKGRISFFSRSNCRDCTAVRKFFREKGLKYVEINVDVYPQREKELFERTGSSSVPQVFFNEKLFGGLVALNSLRNSGGFDRRLKEMLGSKCPDDAPAPPVYGFDDTEEEWTDEMLGIVRVLRQKLPIQDRLMKMKMVKNCFSGSETVEVLIHHLDCGRRKAVDIGRQLARRHFINHVFGENDFEDGNHFYRFLEHEPFIPKCFNFRGSMNDSEPKPAAMIGQRMTKIMSAILESYASDDRHHVDYVGISKSEEFRRYVNLAQELHRVDLLALSENEKLAFFLNLYNAMVIHAVIRIGCPESVIDRRFFFSDFQYVVGGYPYSLNTINHGILRNNRRPPYSLVKSLSSGDKRLELSLAKVNPLIHFGVCNGTRSSPTVRFFSPQGIEAELRCAAREFFQGGGMEVDLEKRTVYLTRIIKWLNVDFGNDKEILKWILNYLDATKAGLLTHLLADGGPINIVYQDYNWSLNS